MHNLKMRVLTAVAALTTTCLAAPATNFTQLAEKLSNTAKLYLPGSTEFESASTRWSVGEAPTVNVVVVPGTENDVAETIKFANQKSIPFLAYNGAHGSITTLGKMDSGIEIYLSQLSSVVISEDGETATIGGGTLSKLVTDTLWDAGKQTVTGTCECVSLLGPALGGGHGWLQGHHGLVADQFVSLNVVLADGTLTTVDENSDLWWAVKGAGHNFGIVTSVTTKIYDIEHTNWAISTFVYTGDKVEAVYQAANDHLLKNGTQAVDVINWSYWFNNPDIDTTQAVIEFYIIQEGVDAVDEIYTQPFNNIGPVSVTPVAGTYRDLAGWTGIATTSRPCQKANLVNPRFPLYLQSYNATAQKQVFDLFSSATNGDSAFNGSLFMFEGYSLQGVKAIESDSTAFAWRSDALLVAPLITHAAVDGGVNEEAAKLGNQLRQILYEGSGREELHTYINYAFGNESPEEWYGHEDWRQERLSSLKKKYDPESKFSFYGPIA